MPKPKVLLSDEAHTALERFATEEGATLAAVVEAFGLTVAGGLPARYGDELARLARGVAAERRSRRLS